MVLFNSAKQVYVGSKIYELTSNNIISEWTVADIMASGRNKNFKLIKEDCSSFCVYEASSLGRDIFTDYETARKEKERRML